MAYIEIYMHVTEYLSGPEFLAVLLRVLALRSSKVIVKGGIYHNFDSGVENMKK